MTPAGVHCGRAQALHAKRARVLGTAYARTPGTVRPTAAHAAGAARCGMAQQAHARQRGYSLIRTPTVSFE